MAHIKPEKLNDLAREFDIIRAIPGVKEKSPGIFYFKSKPLLHFHEEGERRFCHLKRGDKWLELEVAFSPTKTQKAKLLKEASLAVSN